MLVLVLLLALPLRGAAAAPLSGTKAVTSISAVAASARIYEQIHDTATLTGGESPTGTLTFNIYRSGDPTCSETPYNSSTVNVTGNGTFESSPYTANELGAYRWVVEYSGDANNEGATSGCNATNETSTVTKYTTAIASTAMGSTYPGTIRDTATITGGHEVSGAIRFWAYAPDDVTCADTPVYTRGTRISGPGPYESLEFAPPTSGAYRWTVQYYGDTNNEASTSACNAANETSTVAKAAAAISTEATDGTAGTTAISDAATLTGGASPGGTITFDAYGPDDATCASAPAYTDTKTVSGNGTVEAAPFTATAAGTYRWTAEYSGDVNNEAASSGCNAPGETSTVAKASPAISTEATDGVAETTEIHDTATLTGGVGQTGSIIFKAYGPGDTTCSGSAVVTATKTVLGNGSYESGFFRPTEAGVYRWTAEYSGDANNEGAFSGCNAANETSNVDKATLEISTEATDGQAGTTAIHDTTHFSGTAVPTGTVTFRAYGPDDATCSNAPAFTDTQLFSRSGTLTSADFPVAKAGTYRWTAEYSGDANNYPANSGCNSPNETSTVTKASPALTTEAASGPVGAPIHDTAQISGGSITGGTVTFKAYGPDDATCSNAPAFTDTETVNGNGPVGSADFTPTEVGAYRWTADYSGDANNEPTNSGCNAAEETSTASQASPAISTEASDAVAGGAIHDTATLSGGVGATGTITFKAYGPDDSTCSNSAAFTDTEPANGNGAVESAGFTTGKAGAYRWTADYSGDANNEPTNSGCNAAEETSTASQASPAISTEASDAVAGGAIHDTATLSGGVGATGTITFKAYGPNDATCSNAPAFTDTKAVNGNGPVESAGFAAGEAGAYRWTAEYSGDANNEGAASGCNAAEETSSVAKAGPGLSTNATDTVLGSGTIHDTATLSGGSAASGSITFKAFGPNDATCSNAAAFTDTETVHGNGDYTSADFTPTAAGAYRWTAEYSGDANNEGAVSNCNAAEEVSTVAKTAPTISTQATDTTIGGTIHDTATISGGSAASGSITFKAFGPDDADCSGSAAFADTVTVTGNGDYTSADFTPTTAGAYRWTAEYSGDSDNAATSSDCNASGAETSTVAKATPTITTQATDAVAGHEIHDGITIAGGYSPDAYITISVYSSEDSSCDGPFFRDSFYVRVRSNGTLDSPSYLHPDAGKYNWTVRFPGDANNNEAVSPCNAPNETSTVSKVQPSVATSATDGKVGSPIHDNLTISGGYQISGPIYYKAYGPNDPTCSGTPAFVSTGGANEVEDYESDPFTPTKAGIYRWVVEYGGNGSNESATSPCNASEETSTVDKATPTIATQASDAPIGSAIHDTATLPGAVGASGSVTFKAYGPNDATCSGTPAFTDTETVSGGGAVRSADFTPRAAGSYRWTAAYSGDANNEGAAAACNAANESSRVVEAAPRITSEPSQGSVLPGPIHDAATLTGAQSPTGTITFTAYGPDDPTCSGAPAFSSTVQVDANATFSSAEFTPTQPGTYRWIAEYSGDGNNLPATSACGNESGASTVSPPPASAPPSSVSPAFPPASPRTPALSPCQAPAPSTSSVAPWQPPKKVVKAIPGVRAKIRVTKPSQLSITAKLKYRRRGKVHSVKIGTSSLTDQRSANLKMALPPKLAKILRVGSRVRLLLSIAAYPADGPTCGEQATRSKRHLSTKVVRVLVG